MRAMKFFLHTFLLASPFTIVAEAPSVEISSHVDAAQALHQLQEDCWNFTVTDSPELASFVGVPGKHGEWSDLSPEGFARRAEAAKGFYERLQGIDRYALPKDAQLQYDILSWLVSIDVEKFDYPFECLSLNQLDGAHLFVGQILQLVSEPGVAGYESLISRMHRVSTLVDQQIALLCKGMELGIVPPKIVMRSVSEQIANQIAMSAEESEFFTHFKGLDDADIKQRALDAITGDIYPSFNRLRDFVVNEYVPACRETIGLCDLPDGQKAYAHLVKMHTTTALTPEAIHQIGLREVARIKKEMQQVLEEVCFRGDILQFAEFLKEDPNSYYGTKEELLQGYRDLLSAIEGRLPELFTIMPTLPCEVVAVPEYAEASSIMAYYFPGSVETGRPGRFFVNTHRLTDSPKWMMESLALHEALPGHHFQITVAQKAQIPMIQKHGWTTAFVEGWGLYSESLGKELGLYQDPYSYFGRLTHEIMRASRLVVDTGIHAFGWSRQQAIDYYKKHVPMEEGEIINEIDRYIVMPGQALAYKIGEMSLKGLRQSVAAREGESFDIRVFHDRLLQLGGCLPLDALNTYMLE